jgi:hypothetical protein
MARMDRVERLMGPSPLDKAMERMARPPMQTAAMEVFAGRPSPMEKVMKQVGERLTRPLIPTEAMERFARPLMPTAAMDVLAGRPSPMEKVMKQVGEHLAHPLIPAEAMERMARPLMPPTVGEHFARPLMPPVAMETAMDRMMKRLERPLIDTSALDRAMMRLERPLIDTSALDRLIGQRSPMAQALDRVAQHLARPLIDTSALVRAMEHFERSMAANSVALDTAATGLARWLDDAAPFDGALETVGRPQPDPALTAALMEAARTLARRAGNVDLDRAQGGLQVAWATFVFYVTTSTDDEISPSVYAAVALIFALLNFAPWRQR